MYCSKSPLPISTTRGTNYKNTVCSENDFDIILWTEPDCFSSFFFGSSHVSPHLRNLCVISRTVPKDIVGIEQFYWISFSFHTFSMGDTLGSVADRKGAGGCKAWLLNPLFTWLSQGKKIWGSSPAKSRVAHPLQAQGGTRPLSSVTSHRYKTHTSTKHL